MKRIVTLLLLATCTLFAAYAAENNTSLKATKICSPQIDIFSSSSAEGLLGLAEGAKLQSYQVVLYIPGQGDDSEVYKWSSSLNNFQHIMAEAKKHAVAGSLLFIDEIKSADAKEIQQVSFYLR